MYNKNELIILSRSVLLTTKCSFLYFVVHEKLTVDDNVNDDGGRWFYRNVFMWDRC